jgi:hypothetical protein
MKKSLLTATAVLMFSASMASAEMRPYYSSGGWSNAYGTNDDGKRMCSMAHAASA